MPSIESDNASNINAARRLTEKKGEAAETEKDLEVQKNKISSEKNAEIQTIKDKNSKSLVAISKEGEKLSQQMREGNQLQERLFEKNREDHYTKLAADTSDKIKTLDQEAAKKILSSQLSNAHKVMDTNNRFEDPFYRPTALNAKLSDSADSYIVKVNLPPHEAKNVYFSVEGPKANIVKVSLARSAENKAELEPNHKNLTHSYQAITESFSLPSPVDGKVASREYADGLLTIKFPKL